MICVITLIVKLRFKIEFKTKVWAKECQLIECSHLILGMLEHAFSALTLLVGLQEGHQA